MNPHKRATQRVITTSVWIKDDVIFYCSVMRDGLRRGFLRITHHASPNLIHFKTGRPNNQHGGMTIAQHFGSHTAIQPPTQARATVSAHDQ